MVNLGDCLLRSEGIMSVASALQGGHTKMKVRPLYDTIHRARMAVT